MLLTAGLVAGCAAEQDGVSSGGTARVVDAGPASYPLEHEGSTYYFCMAGCRQSFEQDPAAYLKESRC